MYPLFQFFGKIQQIPKFIQAYYPKCISKAGDHSFEYG